MPRPPDLSRTPELLALCELLLQAECLSMRCTAAQASLADNEHLRRALRAQHHHESGHAALFRTVLASGGQRDRATLNAPLAALSSYEKLLSAVLARGDLAASVVGLQGLLEGIGVELFRRFDAPPVLAPLRRLLLRQEEGHHHLGLRLLSASLNEHRDLAHAVHDFRASASELLHASRGLLERGGVRIAGFEVASIARALENSIACMREDKFRGTVMTRGEVHTATRSS